MDELEHTETKYLVQLARHAPTVVRSAVIPNKADVCRKLVRAAVSPLLEAKLDGSQVHGVFYHNGVVVEPQATPVNGLSEGDRVCGGQQRVDYLRHKTHGPKGARNTIFR